MRHRWAALLFTCLLVGCAGPKIDAARSLAAKGSIAAAGLQQSAQGVYTAFLETPALEAIEVGLVTEDQPATNIDPQQFLKISAALRERVGIAAQLVAVYAAFDDLARYDAAGQMEAGLEGLIGNINNFAALFGGSPINSVAGQLVQISGGLIVSNIQKSQLLKANALIVEALRGYSELLYNPSNRALIVSLAQDGVARRYNVARELWRQGLLSAEPIVAELVSKQGLKLQTSNKITYTSASPALRAAMLSYFELVRDEQVAAVEDEYDTSLKLIGALISAHSAFGATEDVNLDSVLAFVRELQAIAERLRLASLTN